jgi:hypothetical protein
VSRTSTIKNVVFQSSNNAVNEETYTLLNRKQQKKKKKVQKRRKRRKKGKNGKNGA